MRHGAGNWLRFTVVIGFMSSTTAGCVVTNTPSELDAAASIEALVGDDFVITEIAQDTLYGGTTSDKVEVFCKTSAGCPAFRVCDPTSTGGVTCSATQAALPTGGRAVISRGTNLTTASYEAVWIEDCSGTCTEISGTRVTGPFGCASGQSMRRNDCTTATFGTCGAPDLGNGVACGGGSCGDLTCDAGETCSTCPGDCGSCGTAEAFTYTVGFAQNQHGTASSACTSALCSNLKALIDGATTSIDFAIYGIRAQQAIQDALVAAQARGVIVRGVVDSENNGCGNQGVYTYPETVNLIAALSPGSVVCDNAGPGYGYIMHDKFFVFDHAKVWTGSTNVSDTETGGEINGDVVVTFTSAQLATIYTTEFSEMFGGLCHNNKTDNTTHVLGTNHWTDGMTVVESYFAPTDDAQTHAILRLIESATTSIDVAIFYLTDDAIGDALVAARNAGVAVRVIMDATGASSSGSEKAKLCAAGVPLKVENWPGKQHSKWAVADGFAVVFGSQNWTAAGNTQNDENTLYVENPTFAANFVNEFARQWADLASVANCADTSAEGTASPGTCNDGVDNDYDTFVDCADSACTSDPACAPQENTDAACRDGVDNDGDSAIDCADSSCTGIGICALVVNECLPEPTSGGEWIELANPTANAIDVSGTFVDDVSGGSSPVALAAGTVVPANGYLVVAVSSILNNSGSDACRFLDPRGVQVDSLAFSNAPAGSSWARNPNRTGPASWDSTPTPGAANP